MKTRSHGKATPSPLPRRPRVRTPPDSEDKYAKKAAKAEAEAKGLSGDWGAIVLLMVLYTLQGVPMGLAGSVPMLMQASGKATDADQAAYSVVSWPFSLKLLWAPIVDSLYLPKFGRRQTWIFPVQAILGLLLLYSGARVDGMLGGGTDGAIDVQALTGLFLVFFFLAATQDIAVDGLALEVLSDRNKEVGATCNAVGQSLGYFLAYTVFLAMNSKEFCNAYLRSKPSDEGLFSLGDFMTFWGWVFLASTLCLLFVKKAPSYKEEEGGSGLAALQEGYSQMVQVLKLPAVRALALVLLTCRIGTGIDSATPLRLMKHGLPKEHMALIASLVMPVSMGAQAYVTVRYFGTGEAKPMSVWLANFTPRLATVGFSLVLVYLTQAAASSSGLPLWVYALMVSATVVQSIVSSVMFVGLMAFFNRVSDPAIGGTYMTMLNTFANMGGSWPGTATLYAISKTTITETVCTDCPSDGPKGLWGFILRRGAKAAFDTEGCGCHEETLLDGYYPVGVITVLLGVAWLGLMTRRVKELEALPAKAWLATKPTAEEMPSSPV